MRCAKCGAENREGRKFCAKCAAPLARLCPQCGASNEPGDDFCGECAAPLGQPPTASAKKSNDSTIRVAETPPAENLEGERKTVTALFADIKGSTELEQDLDPEEARAIIDPALKLMIDAARRYDGYIVQSTGDGIFALFGAPVAHEDHPQRALYAALRMQEELKRYSAKLVADGGMPIEARIGANTGEVVVRSISTGGGHVEYTPIGHTTNLASRMQAVAPTGSIAISEQTRKLCEGYFTLKPLGPTKVKGVSEAVNVYEVTGLGPLRTRLQRSAGRGLSKFVGRQAEMDALKRAAEQAKGGRGQIVAAMAEAGVGKSRLMFEFKATSAAGWMVLETFSVSHGKASAFLPVLDLLQGYFKIGSDDDARARREKIGGKVLMLDRALEDTLPYLFTLLGIVEGDDPLAQMDAQMRKRRTLDAIKRILLRESLNQPLMVIFEDLHWIDEETQALLNLLADSIANAKIQLLVNYRPEYSHQWNSKTYYSQLRLDPLGKESADEMLAALLGEGAEMAQLKRVIVEKTEGNPFFMEETVQVLLDQGSLVRDGSSVRLTKALGELKIPPTVQAILAARIDRLPPAQKDLLQTLAVIGNEFPLSLVHAVVGTSSDELARMLDDLQLGEFIYEQPAAGDVEYTFKHALTHDVAYNSVLIERRKAMHERIGAALETLYADSLDDRADQLAHHYRRSANVRKAVEYSRRAGQHAYRRGAYSEAISHLSGALELLRTLPEAPERSRQELNLELAYSEVLTTAEGPSVEAVGRALRRARELCLALRDDARLFRVLLGLRWFCFFSDHQQEALELSRQLLALAEPTHSPLRIIWAQVVFGQSLYENGEPLQARAHLEKAVALIPSISDSTVFPVEDPRSLALS
jgi:class 3 adenylate cyclase/tetratricopeptide (TPR) repeat protein